MSILKQKIISWKLPSILGLFICITKALRILNHQRWVQLWSSICTTDLTASLVNANDAEYYQERYKTKNRKELVKIAVPPDLLQTRQDCTVAEFNNP